MMLFKLCMYKIIQHFLKQLFMLLSTSPKSVKDRRSREDENGAG